MVKDTNDRFLNSGAVIPVLYSVALPRLKMLDFVVPIQETSNAFISMVEDTNASNNPKKKKAAPHYVGALLPEIDIAYPKIVSGAIEARGFQMRLPHKIMRESYGAQRLMMSYKTAGFVLAEMIDANILTAITGSASSVSGFGDWDDPTVKPMSQIMDAAHAYKQDGRPYRATDLLLHGDRYFSLLKKIEGMDLAGQNIYGFPKINTETIEVKTFGTVHDMGSAAIPSEGIMLDRNNPAIELHYYVDPLIGTHMVEYETLDYNGNKITKSVPNVGINFRSYIEDDTLDTVLQFRVENSAIVRDPNGIVQVEEL